jgi:dolichol-phosphate mannosyltransferase
MKILFAVPCFNEFKDIKDTISNLKKINKKIKADICVFDDGSTDKTLEVLQKIKEITIIFTKQNNGLSEVFNRIAHYSKENEYDFTIIFDADNQYPHEEIDSMLKFAKSENSDIVLGVRNFKSNNVFSKTKNRLQILGSLAVSTVLGLRIKDATTGFRLYSSKAMENIYSSNSFSYTIETLFYANKMKFKISEYELVNFYKTRESRLFLNNFEYIKNTLKILLNSIFLYKPKLFSYLYFIFLFPGLYLCSRFFRNYFLYGSYDGNIQSLIIGSLIIILTTLIFVFLQVISSIKINLLNVQKSNYHPIFNTLNT